MIHRKVLIPFSNAPRGECRWCGIEIIEDGKRNNRRRWHLACTDRHKLLVDYRRAFFKQNGRHGVCAMCGKNENQVPPRRDSPYCILPEMEVDHIVPLKDGGGHGLENLQLLCYLCHRAKTKEENKRRKEGR